MNLFLPGNGSELSMVAEHNELPAIRYTGIVDAPSLNAVW